MYLEVAKSTSQKFSSQGEKIFFFLYLHEVMDVNTTYCGNSFAVYVSHYAAHLTLAQCCVSTLSQSWRDKERAALWCGRFSRERISENTGLGCNKGSIIALASAPDRTRKKHKPFRNSGAFAVRIPRSQIQLLFFWLGLWLTVRHLLAPRCKNVV